MAPLAKLAVLLLVITLGNRTHAQWNQPYLLPPPDAEVTLTQESAADTFTSSFDEELRADLTLAVINYDGSEKPTFTATSGSSDITRLGIDIQSAEDNKWIIKSSITQDYETIQTYRIEIRVPQSTTTVFLRINVKNVNDNAPNPPTADGCSDIPEGTVGPTNCKFIFSDRDFLTTDAILIIDSATPNLFGLTQVTAIDEKSISANLEVIGTLDYEAATVHMVTVTVNDGAYDAFTQIIVGVKDVADQKPVWTIAPPPILSIDENMAEQTFTYRASDGDRGETASPISYTLLEGEDKFFSVTADADKNCILNIKEIDREVDGEDFKIKIRAVEDNDENSFEDKEIQIFVNDLNDNIPTITPSQLDAQINEATAGDVGGLTVTDLDLGNKGQYRVELMDDSPIGAVAAFRVIPNSGYETTTFTISVVNPDLIDYENETWREIKMKFKVTEFNDTTHVSEVPVTVTVNNLNDETPKFEMNPYTASVEETATAGTLVLQVKATDGDPDDKVTYTFSTANNALSIDADTGDITTTRDSPFDFEYQKEIVLQVVATDTANPSPHSATVPVTLTITDINDTPPRIELPNIDVTVDENEESNYEVTRGVTALDPDGDADLEFAILWDQTTAFSKGRKVNAIELYKDCVSVTTEFVEENKGNAIAVLKTTDQLAFDFEIFDVIYLKLQVTDKNTKVGKATHEVTLTISVENLNDNPPIFDENTLNPKTVRENNKDQLIGFVLANDPDALDDITYDIRAEVGTPEDWVVIKADTGEIRSSPTVDIDAETLDTLEYYVIATENSESGTSTEGKLTITVIDVNDVVPVFDSAEEIVIAEHPDIGTLLVTVSATDGDVSEPYGKNLEYSISKEQQNYFEVDSKTGQVTVKDQEYLDRDTANNGVFSIGVVVTDNSPYSAGFDSNQNTATYSVQLRLTDINDNNPEFQPVSSIPVNENVAMDTVIYEGLYAPDKDEPNTPFSTVTYEIMSVIPSSDEPYFKLENIDNKANILAAKTLDKYGTYTLTIKATDGGDPESYDETDITITVIDLNDNEPIFVWPPNNGFQLRVDVVQEVGTRLVDNSGKVIQPIEGDDLDDPLNGNGQFDIFISGDDDANKYLDLQKLPDETAALIVKAPFDEGVQSFELKLTIRDKGQPSPSDNEITGRVYIINVDEVAPTFASEVIDPVLEWEENDPTVSATLPTATDLNNQNLERPEWQIIYYHIIEGDDEKVFEITHELINYENIPTIKLSNDTGNGLDSDDGPSQYTLKVIAGNDISPPSSNENEDSVITVTINVIDLKDSKPRFEYELYYAGISNSDSVGTEITKLLAIDTDIGDILTYEIVSGSIVASEGYLEAEKDTAFTLDPTSGSLQASFIPEESMKGDYFTFTARVHDTGNSEADTSVQVFLMTDLNRVRFLFDNGTVEVESKRAIIANILRANLGYECAIDLVEEGGEGEPLTSLRAIFVDKETNQLVNGRTVEAKATNYQTNNALVIEFEAQGLTYVGVRASGPPLVDNTVQILTTVLIVVGVVLGSMVALLLVAFVLKTRSLNRRLEALSTTKFGSQESGLNRISMNVPNTNKHAIEGSNPVWNEDVPNYDNQSQHSGDSELIGVEDKPDFAYNNDNFQSSYGNFYGDVDKSDVPYDLDTPATYL
ncbi:cadherin-23-like [Cloeon dipterum]|uniref:cadherin-23-like n=1 Tax=Cloeon dipterum TaxID=197152 RepID=UPI00321F7C4A